MRPRFALIAALLLALSLPSCSGPDPIRQSPAASQTVETGTWLKAAGFLTGVEIQRSGSTGYALLQEGEPVQAGDSLRSPGTAGLAELRSENGALIWVSPGTILQVAQISLTPDPLELRLNLEQGALLALTEHSLGQGFLEVKTANALAAIQDSAMTVSFRGGQTTVACIQDSAALTGAHTTVVLPAGYQSIVGASSPNDEPSPAAKFEADLAQKDPLLWQVLTDRYYHYGFEESPTPDLRLSDTLVPTWTASPTLLPTWTPFAVHPTATGPVSFPIPTRRPTTTAVPNATGPTPEELANQGKHNYQLACQSWNKCVCDSANAKPVVAMQIDFGAGQVTLSDQDEPENSLTYLRQAPNLYSWESSGTSAEITFLSGGWEFWVTNAGLACQLQSFTRIE